MTIVHDKIYSQHLRQLAQSMCEILGTIAVLHAYIKNHELESTQDHPIHHVGNAVFEMSLARAIDKFEVYALAMVQDTLKNHLKLALANSSKKIAFRKLAAVYHDPTKLQELLREEIGENLSLAGLQNINAFFTETLKIPIISKDSAWWIGLLSAQRNAIVHGDGSMDLKSESTLRSFGWSDKDIAELKTTSDSKSPNASYSPFSTAVIFFATTESIMANACAADKKLCTAYGVSQVVSQEEYDELVERFLGPTSK